MTFGLEIGEVDEKRLYCLVNTFINGHNISFEDNEVYIPGFVSAIFKSIEDLKNMQQATNDDNRNPEQVHINLRDCERYIPEASRFLMWGPTTNSILSFLFIIGDKLIMTYEFLVNPPDPNHVIGYFIMDRAQLIHVLEGAVLQLTPGALSRFRE
jgi:hypothetical protein